MLPSSENDTVTTGRIILSKLVNFQIDSQTYMYVTRKNIHMCIVPGIVYI